MNGHVVSSNPGASHTIVVVAAIVLDNIIFFWLCLYFIGVQNWDQLQNPALGNQVWATMFFAFYIIVQMRHTVTLCCRQIARRFSVCKDIRLNSTLAYRLGMYVSYFLHQFLAWFWPQ